MSNEIITCFNEAECTYKECVMYSEEIDTCKLELLKIKPTVAPRAPKRIAPEATEPDVQTTIGGTRLISSLKEGEKSTKDSKINIKGTLMFDAQQKDVNKRDGTTGTVTSILIKDKSGEAKISFWGDKHDQIMEFVKGDELFFEGLFVVNAPWDGKPQISGGDYYKVAKLN